MKHPRDRFRGRLIRRYKRFLADVRLDDGRELTVHCANPGAMTGLAAPGSRVLVTDSGDPRRKLPFSWELVRVPRTWVGVNTARSNAIAGEAIGRGTIAGLAGYDQRRAEVRYGEASRVDWLLERAGGERCWVEVKNATLARDGVALFPDAVTARGLKHLDELRAMVRRGDRAVMLFLINREDCAVFRPAAAVDPDYARGLRQAARAGVEVLAYACRVRVPGIEVERPVPVEL